MSLQQRKNEGLEAFSGKATLILINTMGFPISRHVRVIKAQTRVDQHDRKTLVLVYLEKGKRHRTGTRFADNPVAIAPGWQTVNGAFNAELEGDWTTFEPTAFKARLDQLTNVLYVQSEPEGTDAHEPS